MIMEQLKVIQMTMQKQQGEPSGDQEALEQDMLPLQDVASLLAEKRLREEPDLKKKMVLYCSLQQYCKYVSGYARFFIRGRTILHYFLWETAKKWRAEYWGCNGYR